MVYEDLQVSVCDCPLQVLFSASSRKIQARPALVVHPRACSTKSFERSVRIGVGYIPIGTGIHKQLNIIFLNLGREPSTRVLICDLLVVGGEFSIV